MRFSKYHGIGNDFVMIADPEDRLELRPEAVAAICERRFGVGADGVIRVVRGTDGADFFMDYVNADGTTGEMCGNGIRCLALFARAEGLTQADELKVSTRAGLKTVWVEDEDRVRVDMGAPMFEPSEVPVRWDGADALHAKVELDDQIIEAAIVSVGNPHAVIFDRDPETAPVSTLGPQIERHPMFPNGTNVEWMRVDAPDHVTMRVWERGSGQTLACGTGACAVAVVAKAIGGTGSDVTVSLAGGDLRIEWAGDPTSTAPIFMTGPAVRSFDGEIDLGRIGG